MPAGDFVTLHLNSEKGAMRQRRRRKRRGIKRQLLRRRIVIAVVVAVVMAFILFFADYSLWTRIRLEMEKRDLQEQIAQQQRRRDSLRKLIKRLQTDTLYIEKLAREQYGMVRPGEEVYIFRTAE